MTYFLIEDIELELDGLAPNIDCVDQDELKVLLRGSYNDFPMISFERTTDSNVEVSPKESRFLNDSSHEGNWFIGYDDDDIYFIINLKDDRQTIEIDTFEVNIHKRNMKLGSSVVDAVENAVSGNYDYIEISPFDTDAINFWEHMGYREGNNGYWIKKLD